MGAQCCTYLRYGFGSEVAKNVTMKDVQVRLSPGARLRSTTNILG